MRDLYSMPTRASASVGAALGTIFVQMLAFRVLISGALFPSFPGYLLGYPWTVAAAWLLAYACAGLLGYLIVGLVSRVSFGPIDSLAVFIGSAMGAAIGMLSDISWMQIGAFIIGALLTAQIVSAYLAARRPNTRTLRVQAILITISLIFTVSLLSLLTFTLVVVWIGEQILGVHLTLLLASKVWPVSQESGRVQPTG